MTTITSGSVQRLQFGEEPSPTEDITLIHLSIDVCNGEDVIASSSVTIETDEDGLASIRTLQPGETVEMNDNGDGRLKIHVGHQNSVRLFHYHQASSTFMIPFKDLLTIVNSDITVHKI